MGNWEREIGRKGGLGKGDWEEGRRDEGLRGKDVERMRGWSALEGVGRVWLFGGGVMSELVLGEGVGRRVVLGVRKGGGG